MKNLSTILHLCILTLCIVLCSCSSKEEKPESTNQATTESIILIQPENDPDPVIRHEKKSTVTTDAASNLMWSQPSPGPMHYDTIAEYCEVLREGGFSDWRPPTTEELKSIMKDCSGFKEGSGIFYTEKEADTLRTYVNGFYLYDDCFWSFNEKENDQNWFNGYGMVSGKSCLADPDWHPCRPCMRDLCNVACVRESYPKDFAAEKKIEIEKTIDPDKLQWSESTMSKKKNYTAALLADRHIMYTAAKGLCDESWICEENEEREIPCGYLYRDCMDDTFGVHDAYAYCESLREGGFSDWRQPNIDELRTLIQNCDKTKAGGRCRISENRQCLDEKCWSKDCNGCGRINTLPAKTEYYELGEETKKQLLEEINDPKFSRIKSNNAFWSSTLDPENTKEAWGVDFLNARVGHMTMLIDAYDRGGAHSADFPYILDYKLKVVCVRGR